jgi:hypothetical protein
MREIAVINVLCTIRMIRNTEKIATVSELRGNVGETIARKTANARNTVIAYPAFSPLPHGKTKTYSK